MNNGPDWTAMQSAQAVAHHGSVRAAARQLGVSHSTVLRHLQQLEATLEAPLFERTARGYDVTPAGQLVLDTSLDVERLLTAMQRRIQGQDLRLSGPARITMPPALLPLLVGEAARIREAHPHIEITFDTSARFVDLAQRKADIALRFSNAPDDDLLGRRLCRVTVGVYATERYLARAGDDVPLAQHQWVGLADESSLIFAEWMRRHVPDAPIAVRTTDVAALQDGIDANLGVGLVPSAFGEMQRGWRRIADAPELTTWLWLLTHRDLRSTARLRVLRDLFAEAVTRHADTIGAVC